VYLLDTNVISELRKQERTNTGVTQFFKSAMLDGSGLYLSAVTLGELRRGVELIRHRGDAAQATRLEKWLGAVIRDYGQHILPIDDEIAQVWGRLRVPHSEHVLDKLIAATALIHDLTVVTRNVNDFRGTGARLLNPFQ
jgi:predicted nucleic acid-binding protein